MYNMENITFISVFDYGSRELGLNHLQSLKHSGIENYTAYVTDKRTFDYIRSCGDFVVTLHPELSTVPENRKDFGTPDFNRFSYNRYKIVNDLLKQKKAVWYMDVDTVVTPEIRNVYDKYVGKDVFFQNDCHMMCTGCVLYYPTAASINFTEYVWDNASSEKNDQNFIFDLYNSTRLVGLDFGIFDFSEFPNGLLFFDMDIQVPPQIMEIKRAYKSNTNKRVAFIHANWMIGVDAKKEALIRGGVWYS